MKPVRQKSLKPLLEVGQPVYSAYWPPNDPDCKSDPSWYPGIITSYKVSKKPDDDKYGYVRYYSVNFDDGDVMKDVRDHFVMAADEYVLHLHHDESESHSWLGVKNVTDRTSNDCWARHVGWYAATFEGEEHTFSLISDALRAYDSSVVRTKGVEGVQESDLNLADDWKGLFSIQKKIGKNDVKKKAAAIAATRVKEQVKEGINAAQKEHKADLDHLKHQLQKKHKDAKDIAIREAVTKEQRRLREEHHKLKKDMKAHHNKELEAMRDQFAEEMEQAEEEASIAQKKLEQQTSSLKPRLEVGDEVYAAWWPDSNRKEVSSWYSGRIKSYQEEEAEEGEEDGANCYGPSRLYQVKYDDDGTEQDGISEQYVFPKKDYELSTSRPDNHKWTGVDNVLDDSSSDQWAKLIGWYEIATMDSGEKQGETQCFPILSDALHAYDASVVHQKGKKTKPSELNFPEEWKWLFDKNGVIQKQKKQAMDKKELQKEKEKLKKSLEKKHRLEKEVAVKIALDHEKQKSHLELESEKRKRKDTQLILRNDLKEHYEREKAREVEGVRKEFENDKAEAENEASLVMEKLREELLQQLEHEKEKALYWLRLEMQQQQLGITQLKEELEKKSSAGCDQKKKSMRRESSSVSLEDLLPPAKRAKLAWGGSVVGSDQAVAAIGSVAPPNQAEDSIVKETSLQVPSICCVCSKQFNAEEDQADENEVYQPGDQSAGEKTNEEKSYNGDHHKQQHSHQYAAIEALLFAAEEKSHYCDQQKQQSDQYAAIEALLFAAGKMESKEKKIY